MKTEIIIDFLVKWMVLCSDRKPFQVGFMKGLCHAIYIHNVGNKLVTESCITAELFINGEVDLLLS